MQTCWDGDHCVFEVRGTPRESKALKATLVLHRRWGTELGSATMHLEDRVVNVGTVAAPHMILYHCNAGFPLLGASTYVYVSHASIKPRDKQAEVGLDVWNRGAEPEFGFAEQVFIHTPVACVGGKARAAVVNPQSNGGRGLGFEIAYEPESLPALFTAQARLRRLRYVGRAREYESYPRPRVCRGSWLLTIHRGRRGTQLSTRLYGACGRSPD